VTTCIAAITQRYFIVTASDTRLSFGGSYSTDGVLKDEGIHREWGALVAGNDISQAPFVIEEAKRLLRGKSGELNVVKDAFGVLINLAGMRRLQTVCSVLSR